MRRPIILAILFTIAGLICHPAAARAQIRPLDPAIWRAFDADNNFLLDAGIGVLSGQTVSLAGTRGTLDELGLYDIAWRNGRIALHASGTALWRMRNETVVRTPLPGVGLDHNDPGAVVIETLARLSPDASPVLWLLRFGTRLPITSLVSGLDRDESDFFALLALRTTGDLWGAIEAGTSLNGRPRPARGQTDVFTYTLGAGYRGGRLPVETEVWVTGHDDLHEKAIRGNEDLRELRVGLRTRGRHWIGAQWVHGLGDFSPSNGARVMVGFDARLRRVPLLGWE